MPFYPLQLNWCSAGRARSEACAVLIQVYISIKVMEVELIRQEKIGGRRYFPWAENTIFLHLSPCISLVGGSSIPCRA